MLGRIVGGAIQGYGAGLTRQHEANQRHEQNMAGLALREKYLMKRLQMREDRADDRLEKTEQGRTDRHQATLDAQEDRFERQETGRERRHSESMEQRGDYYDDSLKIREKEADSLDTHRTETRKMQQARVDAYVKSLEAQQTKLPTGKKRELTPKQADDIARKEATVNLGLNPDPEQTKGLRRMDDGTYMDEELYNFLTRFHYENGTMPWWERITMPVLKKRLLQNGQKETATVEEAKQLIDWLNKGKFRLNKRLIRNLFEQDWIVDTDL